MKQENRFHPLPCHYSVHFACHYQGPYVSDIRSYYNGEWEDNYSLKLYLSYKVICSKGVSVRPLTVARNIEEFVSLSTDEDCVCVCAHLHGLNTDGVLWI